MFCVEFQEITSGRLFGLAELPTRSEAEYHALKTLVDLGETEWDSRLAISVAGWSWADTRAHGFGVRIFEKD